MDCENDYKQLYVNGESYKTKMCRKYPNVPKWEKKDPKKVNAFIPGTIRDIYVSVGDNVKKGDNLLILEAMKMRNRVKSPINGKIKSILVKSDEIVIRDQLLIEFE